MLKMPKRLDVLVIKTDSAAVNFEIFSYFGQFNLISYKSHGDRVRIQDIYDLSIYTNLYLRENRKANYGNTSITLICSSTPRKFITAHQEHFTEVSYGHFVGSYGMYKIHIVNIETIRLCGPDGAFLSEFCKDIDRLTNKADIERFDLAPQIVDKLNNGIIMRMRVFEGMEDDMVPVADVTDLVMPQIEKAWNDGVKEGKEEGKEEGIKEGVKQAAKGMKTAGADIDFIRRSTGLSREEIKKL